MPSHQDLATLWYSAASEPLGIWLRTPSPSNTKAMLYAARRKLQDPRLAQLQIRTSPTEPHAVLWIVNPEGEGMLEDPPEAGDP